jgi:hypothetical protein
LTISKGFRPELDGLPEAAALIVQAVLSGRHIPEDALELAKSILIHPVLSGGQVKAIRAVLEM